MSRIVIVSTFWLCAYAIRAICAIRGPKSSISSCLLTTMFLSFLPDTASLAPTRRGAN